MSKFIFAVLALVILLVAIVVVAPGLVPVDAYKGRIEAAASSALGRPVTIGDDLSFKIVPQTAFRVTDLVIANAEGFEAPHLARVASADIGVKLIPLFSGSVEIDRFILTDPEINLERNAAGDVNWNFAQSETTQTEEAAGGDLKDIRLGDVRLVNGRASYSDAAADRRYAAEDIDLAVRLDSLSEPLEVQGTMQFEGAPTSVDVVLTSLANVMRQEEANLKLDMTLGETKAGGDLVLKAGETLAYSGPVTLNAPDLRAFAALMGAPLVDSPGFNSLSVSGVADGDPDGIRLSGATIEFDEIDAAGDVALNWAGQRPKAIGRLDANKLDFRPYLPPPAADAQGFPAWSEERMDFTGLRNIDADLNIAADKIFLNDLEFGESQLRLTIDDGRMVAEIPELGIYGGGGSGRLVVDARQATPSIAGAFDANAVNAEPFSKDFMKTDRLLGLGGFKIDFTARGDSQAAIMRTLNGSGGFDIADGALKGVNIAKLARAVDQVRQGGLNPAAITAAIAESQSPAEQTDFSELLSQFSIADGLVSAPTISLAGPFLAMTGEGAVNLPGQTLDLRLQPRASTTTDGEGGRSLAIPMRVTGTFSEPRIAIDVETLLRGRFEQGLQDVIQGLRRPGRSGDGTNAGGETGGDTQSGSTAEQLLRGVLGGRERSAPADESTSDGATDDKKGGRDSAAPSSGETLAGEALNQLFGRRKTEPAPSEEPAEAEPE